MSLHEDSANAATSLIPWTYLASGIAAAVGVVLLSKKLVGSPTRKNGAPLPPGPPPTWFWMNPMPKQNVAEGLAALVEEYGPLVSFRRGSNVTIVIGRMDAAVEIMEKEGAALADRPQMVSVADILSGGMNLIFLPYGDRFRRLRRAVHTHLQPRAMSMYQETQMGTAKEVILDILNDPKHHMQHAARYAAAVILRATYGKSSTRNDDPEVVRIRKVVDNFQSVFKQGAYLVDFIPWLRHVPGYGRQLKEFHRYELSLYRDQMNRVRDDMASNKAESSFSKTLLEDVGSHQLSDDEMAYLSGALYGAGSDTTTSGIHVMVMAAACHPDAQARVQEELDEVVGRDRAPTFGDWDMLPQLQAFLLEALRWRPIAPLGLAHRAMKDIVWRGLCIPAGATVIGSHWAISRDPVAFPDPETFNPGRWLTEEGCIRADMQFYSYGFGRRVCPGLHFANRSLYVNLALLLWSFRILQRPDAPIDTLATKFQDLVVFHPKQFDVEFVPRVEERRLRELMA